MNSELAISERHRPARRAATNCLLLGIGLHMAAMPGMADAPDERTWRTVSELTPAERELYDPRTETPRDDQMPYLPAEPYPFEAPYTAEEMGYRSREFVHVSRWPHYMVDVFGVITPSGYTNQTAQVGYVMQESEPGLEGYIHGVAPGDTYARWLLFNIFPPETEGSQELWLPNRTDKEFRTKMDFFIYTPQMRRVRRFPQPRRDQRFPDNAQTFDDVVGRDAWEFEWRLIGVDVLYETVRFPDTRPTITLNEPKEGFVERETASFKLMGESYPHYRDDGGVECWVVTATPRDDWLPGYNARKLIYWLDKEFFYPLRIEKYNAEGELIFVESRIARQENPEMEERGYAALFTTYWHLPTDLISYSLHDAHKPHEWSPERQNTIFTTDFMPREWLIRPLRTQALVESSEEYFMRPYLHRGKFPDHRKIVLSEKLANRVQAQNEAGRLVFETASDEEPVTEETAEIER